MQIDIILYEGFAKVMFCPWRTKCCSTRLTIERAERDKDTSRLQLNRNLRNHQSLVKETGIRAGKKSFLLLLRV